MAGNITAATIFYRFAGSTKNLQANVASARSALASLTGAFQSTTAKMTAGITVIGVLAAVAFRKAIAAFAAMDAGLREVSTLLPVTAEGLSAVRKELVSISKRSGETPEVLTEAYYQTISAGVTNLVDALALVETASTAAIAGLTDTATAVDALTTVLNAYGWGVEEASRVSDILFTTVQEGKVRFEDLSKNIGTVAKTAALTGVSFEEVSALIATLTKSTGQVEESFTAANRLIAAFSKNTDEARKFAAAAGIEFDVLAVKQNGLLGVLEAVNERFGGNIEALAELTPQYRAFRGLVIAASDEGLEQFRKSMIRAQIATGATQDALTKMRGSLDYQKRILKQDINALWLNLGVHILPKVANAFRVIALAIEDPMDRQIRQLREIGREEEALALTRIKLERDFAIAVEEAQKRRIAAFNNLKSEAGTYLIFLEQAAQKLPAIMQTATSQAVVEGLSERDRRTLARKLEFVQVRINSLLEEGVDKEQARADAAQILTTLKSAEKYANEELLRQLINMQTIVGQINAAIQDEIINEETLNELREKGVEAIRKALEDDDDQGIGLVSDEEKQKIADAIELIDEVTQRLTDLEPFEINPFAELPDAVEDYVGQLDTLRGKIAELREAADAVEATDPERAASARAYARALEIQLNLLQNQQKAIADSLKYIEQYGTEVVDLFKSLTQEQRTQVGQMLASYGEQARLLEQVRTQIDETIEGTEERTEAEERYQRVLDQTKAAYQRILVALRGMGLSTKQLAQAQALFAQASSNAGISGGGGDDSDYAKKWKKIGREIEGVARGVIGIADALGILDDQTRQVLDGIVNLGGAVANIASGNIFAGVAQGIGGISQIVGGLFGGGPSAEEQKIADAFQTYGPALADNSRRLLILSQSMEALAQELGQFPLALGREFGDLFGGAFEKVVQFGGRLPGATTWPVTYVMTEEIRNAVVDALYDTAPIAFADYRESVKGLGLTWTETIDRLVQLGTDFAQTADDMGLSIYDLNKLAQAAGIDIPALTEALEKAAAQQSISSELAAAAALELQQLDFAVEEFVSNLVEYNKTLEGAQQLADLRAEFRDLGDTIEEQVERLDLFREAMKDFGATAEDLAKITDEELRDKIATLFSADISTAEGRSALDEALRYIAENFDRLPPEAFGGMSIEEFIAFIRKLEGSLDDMTAATEEATDESKSFQVFRGITEITGNRIAGILTTDTYWNRLTALNTAQIADALGIEGVKIDEIDMPENVWEEIAANITLIALQNRQLRDIALDVRDLVVRSALLSSQAQDRVNTFAIVRAIQGAPIDVQAGLDAGPVAKAVENLVVQPQPITDIQPLVQAIRDLTIEPDTLVDIQPLVQAINRITIDAPEIQADELLRGLQNVEINPEPITDIQPLVDVIRNIVIEPTILSDPKSLVEAINDLALQPTVVTDVEPLVEAVEGVEIATKYEVNVQPLVEAIRNMRLEVSPVVDFDELIFALKQTTIEPETIANFEPLVNAISKLNIETQLITDVRPLVDAIANLTIDATVEVSTQELVAAIQKLPIQPRFIVDTQPFAEALSRIQLDIKDALDVSRIVTAIQAIDVDPSQVIDITPLADAIEGFEIDPTNVFDPDAIIDAIERVNIDVRPEYDVQPLVDAIRALEITNTNEVDLSPLRDAIDLIDISVDPVLDVDPLIEALREFALRIEQVVNRDDLVAAIEGLNIENAVQFNVRPIVNAIEAVLENEPPTIDTDPIREAIAGLEVEPRIVVALNPLVEAIRSIDIAPESLLDAESIIRAISALELEPRIVVETQPLVDAVEGLQLDPRIVVDVDPILLAIRDLLTQLRVVADPNAVVNAIEDIDIAPRYETDITPIIEAIQNLTIAAPTIDLTPLSEALLGASETLRAAADPTDLLDAVRALEAQFRPEIDVQPIAEVVNRINEKKLESGPLLNAIRNLEIRPVVITDAEPIVDAIRAYATNSDLVIPITSFIDELRRSVIARPVEAPAEQLLEAFLNATQFAQPAIGTLNVEVSVEYTGQDEGAAQEFGTAVGSSVMSEIDRQMANRYIQTTRATGSPTKRTA